MLPTSQLTLGILPHSLWAAEVGEWQVTEELEESGTTPTLEEHLEDEEIMRAAGRQHV